MESLAKYLESETVAKQLIEESEQKVVEERIYVSPPPAKKSKFDEKDSKDVDIDSSPDGDWDNSEWDSNCEAECGPIQNINNATPYHGADSNPSAITNDTSSWKKSIREGDDYQATVPPDLCPYDDPSLYHNSDKKLWEPGQITEEEVKEYLKLYNEAVGTGKDVVTEERWKEIAMSWPKQCDNNTKEDMFKEEGEVVDDEQGLYLLHQCGYSVEEALRRAKLLRRLLLKQKYLA